MTKQQQEQQPFYGPLTQDNPGEPVLSQLLLLLLLKMKRLE